VQGAERLALEPQAVGRGLHPQRSIEFADLDVTEASRREFLRERAIGAQADGPG
jgi:hypothetical protein